MVLDIVVGFLALVGMSTIVKTLVDYFNTPKTEPEVYVVQQALYKGRFSYSDEPVYKLVVQDGDSLVPLTHSNQEAHEAIVDLGKLNYGKNVAVKMSIDPDDLTVTRIYGFHLVNKSAVETKTLDMKREELVGRMVKMAGGDRNAISKWTRH